jgi:hypothetical protein
VLITSAANNLNKAHVKYLEAHLVEIARSIGKVPLENWNTPARSSLSEAGQANMESFLDYLLMVLPALRIDMFLSSRRTLRAAVAVPSAESSGVSFDLNLRKHGIAARPGRSIKPGLGDSCRDRWSPSDELRGVKNACV